MATTVKDRYEKLINKRRPFLDRARDAAVLTIPALYPPEGFTDHSKLKTPFQSMGSRGVNNLTAKFLLSMFPPNAPFFRFIIEESALDEINAQRDDKLKTAIDKALGKMERTIMQEVETIALRVSMFEAIRHLLVAGNVLIFTPKGNGGVKVFTLENYVCVRDTLGNPVEIITHEKLGVENLEGKVKDFAKKILTDQDKDTKGNWKELDIYTHVQLKNGMWRVRQELKGMTVPGTIGTYPQDKSPWQPLRYIRIDGQDYGRGHVEEYMGDLKSLETLSQAIVEGSAAAAKVLFLVKPNSTTRVKVLAEAENGDFVNGNETDVTTLKLDKAADFQIAFNLRQELVKQLSFAFLLNTSIQRSGERVTAEEIRYMAKELEDTLGGTYALLSQELQLPLVNRLVHRLQKQRKLPQLPKGLVKPAIITGIEALGRGNDLARLDQFTAGIVELLGPEGLQRYMHVDDYLARRATAIGLDTEGLVKTVEEIAAEDQQMQMQQAVQQFGPEAMRMAGEAMKSEPTSN